MTDATMILERLSRGDSSAANELFPIVYDNLRAMAGSYFRGQPTDLTIQPTALVHEAYMKLIRSSGAKWDGKGHFMAVAATAMRQILLDRARQRRAQKHGGDRQCITLSGVASAGDPPAVDLLALDEALTKLEELDERQYRIVELRFFGGLDVYEVADVLQLSKSTVEKEWTRIRAWLSHELSGTGS